MTSFPSAPPDPAPPRPVVPQRERLWSIATWAFALLLAIAHIAPFWRAQLSARDGWTFTENLTISPDHMQYRVWLRQSQVEGVVISNRFTTEPNTRHLPVAFFWVVGKVAAITGATPEAAYAYAGSLLAALLAVITVATVREFLPDRRRLWWVVITLFAAGGLGGHLKILAQVPVVNASGAFSRFFSVPMEAYPPFEDYRSHYLLKVLLDTHSIALWIVGLLAVLALLRAVERPGAARIAVAAAALVTMTVLHVYEGITLLAIAAGVAACCWTRATDRKGLVALVAWSTVAVGACYVALGALYASGGLPLPTWTAIPIMPLIVLMAYPIAIALIAWGGPRLWREAGLRERFLFGWALGCTVVTFSGPIFPYPDRGTLTMQVPLFVLGAIIYFARWPRVARWHAVVLIAICGATPAWLAARTWHFSGFRTDAPFQFVNPAHRETLRVLASHAQPADILLAEPPDLLWLAPEFPGRLYVGHFFLTIDFTAKVAALRDALASPERLPALLRESKATLLFVQARRVPEQLGGIAGLEPLDKGAEGWLFRVRPSGLAVAAPGTPQGR